MGLRCAVVFLACGAALAATIALAQQPQEPAPTRPPMPGAGEPLSMRDGAVELHVVDTPLPTVLRMLSVQGKRNIIATPAVKGMVTADLYNVSFDDALRAVLVANNCDFTTKDGFIYVYTRDELAAVKAHSTPITSRIFHLNYVRAGDVLPAIEPLISKDGTIVKSPEAKVGIEAKATEAGGDSHTDQDFIVVYDYPDELAIIAELIRLIDVRPRQVLVEATILRARLTDDNALGIDFTLVGGVDLELLGATSRGIQDLALGELPENRLEKFNSNLSTSFASNVPEGGATFGIIKDNVAVFLRALEQVTDTSVIANPKVLALNKQIGNVIVGRRDGYITTTVTQTQAVQKVEFLETGTQLTFRPFIGTDDYVRMELHPEDSVGGLTAAQLPFEQTTEVTTNIIVHDGYTILIGGLFREVDSNSRSQLPVLGDIPAVGDLFRSRNDAGDREEVIVLLTVHIIKNDDQFAALSSEVMEDIERSRVSLRAGTMWHGRERLAQAYYRAALDHYSKGHDTLALWSAELAIDNYPRNVAAIELKEQILRAREWEDDAALARTFVTDLLRSPGQEHSVYGRPPRPMYIESPALDREVDDTSDSPK